MSRTSATAISLVTLLGLANAALAENERPEILDVVGLPPAGTEVDRPVSIYMVIPPEPEQEDSTKSAIVTKAARYTIYMNRNGGVYTPGFNDSRTNRSSIALQTTSIDPWNVSEQGWQQVMSCVQDIFAPYNVVVTDVDPGSAPHIESVVAGRPQDLDLEPGVAGVSPFTNNCSIIDNSIVFTFAGILGTDYQFICEVAAQEIAHSFGLDHEYLCEDPMTYLSGCGAKTFQNVDAQCGEFSPRQCYCNGSKQNSVEMLTQRIGLIDGPVDAASPVVDISYPADGAVVAPGFTVTVAASDDVGIERVELYINDLLVDTLTSAPWTFALDDQIPEGTYLLETRAYDLQNVSVAQIAITVSDSAVNPSNPSDPGVPGAGSRPSEIIGGCQAAGQGSAGSMLFVIGLAAVLVGRRRRA